MTEQLTVRVYRANEGLWIAKITSGGFRGYLWNGYGLSIQDALGNMEDNFVEVFNQKPNYKWS